MATKKKADSFEQGFKESDFFGDDDHWGDVEIPTLALKEAGDRLAGYYLGSRQVLVTNKKNGEKEIRTLHQFDVVFSSDGSTGRYDVWGSTHSDRLLGDAELGRLTRVERTPDKAGDMIVFRVAQRGPTEPERIIGRERFEMRDDA